MVISATQKDQIRLDQWFCAFVDHSAKSFRSLEVVLCDEGNDLQQVLFGIRMPDDRPH